MEMDEDFFKEEIYYKDLYYTTKGKEQCGYFSKGRFRFRIQSAKSQFRVKKIS